ncbi:MAG: polysaccharide deacetylase family protein [Acidobacteriia bacterium]|nr:polysaccharide deacetylase family protein [Terriglobia bacterium]
MSIRAIIKALLRWTGFFHLWRFLHRKRVTILMLHATAAPANGQACWAPLRPQLDPQTLEQWLRLLTRYYKFVSLDDAVEMLAGNRPFHPNSLVVTFDDGYRNNVTGAWPVLRRFGVPATIFVTAGHVQRRQPFWVDRLDYALQHAGDDDHEFQIGNDKVRISASGRNELRQSYQRLRDAAKAVVRQDGEMREELEQIAATLEAESGRRLADVFEDDPWTALLSWEEIEALAGTGLSFESHTVDHVLLGRVEDGVARDQLLRSKRMIEAHTKRPCRYLAYPNGSYNARTVEIVRECGYMAAVTVNEGTNRTGADPMTLQRIALPLAGSETELLAVVSGITAAIARAKQSLLALLNRGNT